MIGKKLFSLARADGTLVVYLEEADVGEPGPDEVVLRVDAAPINPSDLALVLATADPSTLRASDAMGGRAVEAVIPAAQQASLVGRINVPMPIGNEGAGLVINAGRDARHLLGKTVACIGRAMYAQFARVPASICHILPEDVTADQGAAGLVNPLTVLAMIDTMQTRGHSALVHTAAASSLGQMMNRVCLDEGIPLVNIVRKREQAELLERQGAQNVCVSGSDDFTVRLADALERTRATIAFDAIGGGPLIGQLLLGMEAVALRHAEQYSRYGSMTRKTVYVYGKLDARPIEFQQGFDFAWNVAAWLLPLTPERMAEFWPRISGKLTTTFATEFGTRLSLDDLLVPDNLMQCAKKATGQKTLVTPNASLD